MARDGGCTRRAAPSVARQLLAISRREGQFPRRETTFGGSLMATVEKSIDVDVPVSVAYNQWTQFESFPQFMEGVKEVHQLDDTHLRWRAEIGGKEKEWTAEITDQLPDERVAWRGQGRHGDAWRHRLRGHADGLDAFAKSRRAATRGPPSVQWHSRCTSAPRTNGGELWRRRESTREWSATSSMSTGTR